MRLSIFICALAIHDIAQQLGASKLDYDFWGWFFILFLVMDIIELSKKMSK